MKYSPTASPSAWPAMLSIGIVHPGHRAIDRNARGLPHQQFAQLILGRRRRSAPLVASSNRTRATACASVAWPLGNAPWFGVGIIGCTCGDSSCGRGTAECILEAHLRVLREPNDQLQQFVGAAMPRADRAAPPTPRSHTAPPSAQLFRVRDRLAGRRSQPPGELLRQRCKSRRPNRDETGSTSSSSAVPAATLPCHSVASVADHRQ